MKTVLIADNDAFQRQLIDMLLAVDDYQIIGFETGRQVLEYLQSHVPDIAVFDYNLPDINGADLCAKLRGVKRLSKVPVILVTSAHKLSLVKGIATAVKANAVLAKPLGDKKLREQVQALIKPSLPENVLKSAIPVSLDPILEQALDHLPHLTQSGESLQTLDDVSPAQDLEFAEALPPMDITDLLDTQSLQDKALPSMNITEIMDSNSLQGVSSPQLFSKTSTSSDTGANQINYDDVGLGSISEQELLDSLQIHLENSTSSTMVHSDDLAEPQVYHLTNQDSLNLKGPAPLASTTNGQSNEKEFLTEQLEQLSSENEQLKATLRELDSGHPLHASHSYLNAIEELEMLRRLTGIQTKQLNELQRQNESLIDEVQLLKSQRRSGFFGFRSGKRATRDST